MPGNTFGHTFRITTFGESHGEMIGVVIDGCPAGMALDVAGVQRDLDRRRPGQSAVTTARAEADRVRFVAGLFEGRTTGAPLAALIENKGQRPADYDALKDTYRPSHADYSWDAKYGHRDHRGGGRSSARETAARVIAGAVARQLLRHAGITVTAYVSRAGAVALEIPYTDLDLSAAEGNPMRCPDGATAEAMRAAVEQARQEGDSLGGVVTCVIAGCPPGLGEPVFGKLQADLAGAMLGINAVHGFEYGSGFAGAARRGSENNDAFTMEAGTVKTTTNRSGGIQGGISNGNDIFFNVAFKPVATIARTQQTVTRQGKAVSLEAGGRHDPCVVPRAVPIVEAMAAIVLADHWLRNRTARLEAD